MEVERVSLLDAPTAAPSGCQKRHKRQRFYHKHSKVRKSEFNMRSLNAMDWSAETMFKEMQPGGELSQFALLAAEAFN